MDKISNWDKHQVLEWLSSNGYASYEQPFLENDITGDILIHANHEMLKELSITSIGQRVSLLKLIFNTKIAQGVPIEMDDYIPENAVLDTPLKENSGDGWSLNNKRTKLPESDYSRLEGIVKNRDETIHKLNTELYKLNEDIGKLKEELSPVWALIKEYKNFQHKSEQKKKGHSKIKSSQSSSSIKSSAPKNTVTSPNPIVSPPTAPSTSSSFGASSLSARSHAIKTTVLGGLSGPRSAIPNSASSSTASKQSPLDYSTMESPTTSLNPLSDSNGSYGAIRVYGDKLLGRENESYKSFRVSVNDSCSRILPSVLKKYKIDDSWQNYALFIQHKGQERCLSFDEKPLVLVNQLRDSDNDTVFILKHIKQVVNPVSRTAPILEHTNPMSTRSPPIMQMPSQIPPQPLRNNHRTPPVKMPVQISVTNDSTYAVAIYEYKAARDDEFDVAIGDRFVNIKKEGEGWCKVEKADGKRGWVPTGCLLEPTVEDDFSSTTNSVALSSHSTNTASIEKESNTTLSSNNNIASSASSPSTDDGPGLGLVLYDYSKASPNELNIKKGDTLVIHKKFQHWLLAADHNNQRGWVPSCYVSIEGDNDPVSAYFDNDEKH